MRKKFILLEGGDGAGKSACALEIVKAINGVYYKTPPPIFDSLRQTIEDSKDYNLRFYYFLTGVIHSSREIAKLLETTHVVCDRYLYTTIAYHRALGVIIPDGLEKLILLPDYCFCLHVRDDVMRKRIGERATLGVFDEAFELQRKVLEEFKSFNLELFDTSDLSAPESAQLKLQKMKV